MTVFDKFGGVRPMAEHLKEAPSTVQSWKTAGRIPAPRQPAVLAKAKELAIGVTAEDVIFPLGRGVEHHETKSEHDAASAASATASSSGNMDHLSAEVGA